jgi:serine/threonine-protein kinase
MNTANFSHLGAAQKRTCPACQRIFDSNKSYCVYDGHMLVEWQEVDPLVNRLIDNKYSIDYKIAEGGTGVVYRATHLQLQSVIAIKVMHSSLTEDVVAVERFRREAYAAMKVRHPNAVAVLDFGITEDRLIYVVMELLVGQSLADRIKMRNQFSPLEANHLIQQVCAAVNVAHSHGIVHRDLKPDNIFLHQENGQETVKVLDFGIAKMQEFNLTDMDITGGGTVIGTPFYISPEQCSSQPVDARSDVYSLGIVLYQLLTGKLPFEGPSSIIVLLKQLNEKPLPIYEVKPGLPQLLNAVVMRALEKDPRSRQQSMTAFGQELATATRAVSESEFQDVFLDATEKELEAALLLAGDTLSRRLHSGEYNRPRLLTTTEEKLTHSGEKERVTNKVAKRVQGHLSWFDLASITYILLGLQETGALTFHKAELAWEEAEVEQVPPFAWLYLNNGNITHARLGVRGGCEAFYQLFQMPLEGCFLFKQGRLPAELEATPVITEMGTALLREALGLRTLLNRFKLKFPDMLVGFHRSSDIISWQENENAELAGIIWQMLEQPGITLSELLARSPCCNAKTYQVLAMLLATKQIISVKTVNLTESLDSLSSVSNQ